MDLLALPPFSSVDIGIPTSHVMSALLCYVFPAGILVLIAWSLIRITILLDDFLEYGVEWVCANRPSRGTIVEARYTGRITSRVRIG